MERIVVFHAIAATVVVTGVAVRRAATTYQAIKATVIEWATIDAGRSAVLCGVTSRAIVTIFVETGVTLNVARCTIAGGVTAHSRFRTRNAA